MSGITVNAKYWNHDKQEIKKHDGNNASLLNLELNNKRFELEETLKKLISQNIPITKEAVLNNSNVGTEVAKSKSFYNYFDEFLEERVSNLNASTKQKYGYLRSSLIDFSEKYKCVISFANMNETFIGKFENYFLKDKGIFNNSLGTYIKNLKAFLRWASEKGYNTKATYKDFVVYKEDADIFPLTETEIKAFEKVTFKGMKEDVKNVFLFQIYTGLRISDTQRLTFLHFDQTKNLITKFRAKKTGDALNIPITAKCLGILNKYTHLHKEGRIIPNVNTQVANRYLKIMAEEMGLVNEVIYNRKRGREFEEFTAKRSDIISTHDGRRTFITHCLTKGMSPHMIMSITGHKNYKTFERYIKFSETDIKNQLELVWK